MPEKAEITSAADVAWDSGDKFNGFLLLMMALPGSYTSVHLLDEQKVRVPTRIRIPIKNGDIQDTVQVWRTDHLVPPNVLYCSFWYDDSGTQIATTPSLFAVTADPHTIVPPALAAPSAAGSCPTPGAVPSDVITGLTLVQETPSGTMNGANKTFTISFTPQFFVGLFWNGAYQESGGTDYTRSDKTITMVVAPSSGDNLRAVYFK